MIETRERGREEMYRLAFKRAVTRNNKELISITKRINNCDPLQFFVAAEKAFTERTFWTSHDRKTTYVGIGSVVELVAQTPCLEDIKSSWNEIVDQAWVINPYSQEVDGLTLFGGIPFDPLKKSTALWSQFTSARFHLPKFILTKSNDRTFVTMNVYITKESNEHDLDRDWAYIDKLRTEQVWSKFRQADIKETEEIAIEEWLAVVTKAKDSINSGEASKIVLAREMRVDFTDQIKIEAILDKLLQMQASSYIFALQKGSACFVGATPERLIKVENEQVFSACIAGTAPRGKDNVSDSALATQLLQDKKNREEHDFVVTMIKEALQNHCDEVYVPDQPIVYKLENLQHLFTPVTAKIQKDESIFDLVEVLHPTPALGGTPKEESLLFIREEERLDRGWYGAPIGWVNSSGNGEFAVAIRSGMIQEEKATLFAGCGIVSDSDPLLEYEETNIKFMPMLSALGGTK